MRTLIFRTAAPFLTALMLLFSVFVLLRGHNEPGGGFIGGLIAASAFAIHGLAFGVPAVRRALHFHPMAVSGFGLALAALSPLAERRLGLCALAMLLLGVLLFSASLAGAAMFGWPTGLAPMGGGLMILGWLLHPVAESLGERAPPLPIVL